MRRAMAQIVSKMKDPRVAAHVTVTSVQVAKDLKTAKVRVEIYGTKDGAEEKGTYDALCRSGGYIRKELSQQFRDLRTIPELTFTIDRSLEYSAQIDKILEEIKSNDEHGK